MKTKVLTLPKFYFQEIDFTSVKFYLFSALFISGNLILPYLIHLTLGINGGRMLLPIYFFVLIGAYQFGWKVGLTTAILSPTISHMLTGMPVIAVLPIILIKSIFLALGAGVIARKTKELNLLNLALAVFGYQIIGSSIESSINKNLSFSDLFIGYPGLFIQIIGGYLLIKLINKFN